MGENVSFQTQTAENSHGILSLSPPPVSSVSGHLAWRRKRKVNQPAEWQRQWYQRASPWKIAAAPNCWAPWCRPQALRNLEIGNVSFKDQGSIFSSFLFQPIHHFPRIWSRSLNCSNIRSISSTSSQPMWWKINAKNVLQTCFFGGCTQEL